MGRLKLLQPQKLLRRHRLLPLRKLPPRKLLPQPQRLPPQPNTQRGIAHRQPKRQPQRSQQPKHQPQSSHPQTVHQQVATVMRAVLNASLSLETARQRSTLTACLVEEIPCNLGGRAMTTSASAKLAETFSYKRG